MYRQLKILLFLFSLALLLLLWVVNIINFDILKIIITIYSAIVLLYVLMPPPSRAEMERMKYSMGRGYAYYKNKKGEVRQKRVKL